MTKKDDIKNSTEGLSKIFILTNDLESIKFEDEEISKIFQEFLFMLDILMLRTTVALAFVKGDINSDNKE